MQQVLNSGNKQVRLLKMLSELLNFTALPAQFHGFSFADVCRNTRISSQDMLHIAEVFLRNFIERIEEEPGMNHKLGRYLRVP